MKSSHLILPAAGLSVLAWALMNGGDGRAQPASGKLPGASPVVEAIDFPTIQAALDALPPAGGVVRLPAGTFEISEPLRVSRGDVLLEGAGTATHIKNVNTEGEPAIRIQPGNLAADPKAMLWRVKLADLRVTGNPKSGHGIEAVNVNEIFLHGVTVSEHGGDGVRLVNCYEDPRVCNSLFTYNKAAGLNLVGCHDIVVSANQFEENQRRPPLHRRLQPLHDGQLHRRPPARRRRDREHVRLGRRRQHDRGVQGDGDHPRPRLLRHHARAPTSSPTRWPAASTCATPTAARSAPTRSRSSRRTPCVIGPAQRADHRHRQQLLQQLHRRRGGQARHGRPRRQRHHPERDLRRRREREPLLGRHPEGPRGRGGAEPTRALLEQRADGHGRRPGEAAGLAGG